MRTQFRGREFLIGNANPDNAPRMAPAVQALHRVLSTCESVGWTALVRAAHAASPSLHPGTIRAWLYDARKAGIVIVTGEYHGPKNDTREVRLGDW